MLLNVTQIGTVFFNRMFISTRYLFFHLSSESCLDFSTPGFCPSDMLFMLRCVKTRNKLRVESAENVVESPNVIQNTHYPNCESTAVKSQ